MNEYLASLEFCQVQTLEDIIQFNRDHAEKELPKGKTAVSLVLLILDALFKSLRP